jgi:hypothetical protein
MDSYTSNLSRASSHLKGRIKGIHQEQNSPSLCRSISLPIKFPSFNSPRNKQYIKSASTRVDDEPGSLQVDDKFDDSTDAGSELSNSVIISVHDTEKRKNDFDFSTEVVQNYHDDEDTSCVACITNNHFNICSSILYDSFFVKEPEPKQRSASSPRYFFDEVTTTIECILKAAYEEDREELVENEGTTIPPQIQISRSSQMCLPHPSEWKQQPLLLTLTPNSGMKICGIRRLCDPCVINRVHTNGSLLLQLPINNGKEQLGQSWVIDFETELFAGTALFRIRDCNTCATDNADRSTTARHASREIIDHDYFREKNRKYQLVIRGRFKQKIMMASCMSGLLLDQPLVTSRMGSNNAPPRWILRAAVKVANIFSPRMDADLEGNRPRVLSPLCSTAQTVRKHDKREEPIYLDKPLEEPHPDSTASLIGGFKGERCDEKDNNHAQYRKRFFNAIYDDYMESEFNTSPYFDDTEYTFEFLQHLVDYNDLSLDLGRAIGKVKLGGGLRGQPVRIAAISNPRGNKGGGIGSVLSDQTCLWAFDLWHSSNVYLE